MHSLFGEASVYQPANPGQTPFSPAAMSVEDVLLTGNSKQLDEAIRPRSAPMLMRKDEAMRTSFFNTLWLHSEPDARQQRVVLVNLDAERDRKFVLGSKKKRIDYRKIVICVLCVQDSVAVVPFISRKHRKVNRSSS